MKPKPAAGNGAAPLRAYSHFSLLLARFICFIGVLCVDRCTTADTAGLNHPEWMDRVEIVGQSVLVLPKDPA